MNKLLLTILMACSFSAFTQDYTFELTIANFEPAEVYLADFYGDRNTLLDSAMVDSTGWVKFAIPATFPSGMYRLFLGEKVFFDFIFNKENIRIETDVANLYEGLEVIESTENQLYYDFLRTKHDYRVKFDLLASLNDYYPPTDSFFHIARGQYIGIQAEIQVYINDLMEQYPNAWVNRIIRQQKPLFFDPSMDEYARRNYKFEHFFDHYDFTDIELIRTNVYTTAAIEYMSLYSNPNLNQEQLENEFIKAVDKIMYETLDNSLVYEFMVEYLVGGFERYHFEKVLDYIAMNYTPEQCENDERKTDLQTRLSKYAELSVGKKAPEIEINDVGGNLIKLSKLKSDYLLVIFWASWCPHCNDMLPEIHNIYQSSINSKKMQVLSISLDSDKTEWTTALQEEEYTWLNASDLKGWDGASALDYNIYATPTMFLLDKEKHILAKPITMKELKSALFENNIIK